MPINVQNVGAALLLQSSFELIHNRQHTMRCSQMAETKEADRLERLLEHDSCLVHLISLSPPRFESHCTTPLNGGTGGSVAAGAGATLRQPLCQGGQLCLTHLF